jgi:hypothetical protein
MPALMTDAELEALLRGGEGSRIEFKTTAQRDDVKKAVVAFANTIREPDRGVLFIGVKNDATIVGVPNPDAAQKEIRKHIEECYPPIEVWEIRNLIVKGQTVLAIIVPESRTSPHFTGPAYVRQGSESVKASAAMYEQLLADHVSAARRLRPWVGKEILVEQQVISPRVGRMWNGSTPRRKLLSVDAIGITLELPGLAPIVAD